MKITGKSGDKFCCIGMAAKKIPGLSIRPGIEMEGCKSVFDYSGTADSVFAVQAQNVSTPFGRQLNLTDGHR